MIEQNSIISDDDLVSYLLGVTDKALSEQVEESLLKDEDLRAQANILQGLLHEAVSIGRHTRPNVDLNEDTVALDPRAEETASGAQAEVDQDADQATIAALSQRGFSVAEIADRLKISRSLTRLKLQAIARRDESDRV